MRITFIYFDMNSCCGTYNIGHSTVEPRTHTHTPNAQNIPLWRLVHIYVAEVIQAPSLCGRCYICDWNYTVHILCVRGGGSKEGIESWELRLVGWWSEGIHKARWWNVLLYDFIHIHNITTTTNAATQTHDILREIHTHTPYHAFQRRHNRTNNWMETLWCSGSRKYVRDEEWKS